MLAYHNNPDLKTKALAIMARLEDSIFEALPFADAQAWPERFLGAIQPGADLSRVIWQFLDWLLEDLPKVDDANVTEAVARVRREVTGPAARGEKVDKEVARKAANVVCAAYVAYVAACASEDTPRAADAVDAARVVDAAAYAARAAHAACASEDTARAAYAVDAAAYAAAYAARAVRAADAARAATAARQRQANQLIKLLEAA